MSKTLEEIIKEHDSAVIKLREAQSSLCESRRSLTFHINAVNKLQKEFDAALAIKKGQAPRDTDWNKRKGEQVQ